MTDFIVTGTVLGLSAGFAPGPLLTLVISEALRHDIKSGIRVAISPVFTDLPIVVLTLVVLSQLSGFKSILGVISLVGGCVILYMGYESMNPKAAEPDLPGTEPKVQPRFATRIRPEGREKRGAARVLLAVRIGIGWRRR